MNFLTRASQQFTNYSRISLFPLLSSVSSRNFNVTSSLCCENIENPEEKVKEIDPEKDRTKIIPVETSIRYLKSSAYATTYGDQPVWVPYRRNFKGPYAPRKTRKTCIRDGIISTGNPCPICRDEYLVLDHRNVNLLKQFISEHTGDVSKINFNQQSSEFHIFSLLGFRIFQNWIVSEETFRIDGCGETCKRPWTPQIRCSIQRLLRIL
jgi:hypothetical protein